MDQGDERLLHNLFIQQHHSHQTIANYKLKVDALNCELDNLRKEFHHHDEQQQEIIAQQQRQITDLEDKLTKTKRQFDYECAQSKSRKDELDFLQQKLKTVEQCHADELIAVKESAQIDKESLRNELQQLRITSDPPLESYQLLQLNREELLREVSKLAVENDYLKSEITVSQKKIDAQTQIIQSIRRDKELATQTMQEMATKTVSLQYIIKSLRKKDSQYKPQIPKEKHKQTITKTINSSHLGFTSIQPNPPKVIELQEQVHSLKRELEFANKLQQLNRKRYYSLVGILSSCLHDLLEKRNKPSNDHIGMQPITVQLDVEELRKKPAEKWSKLEMETVLNLLLNQIRPFLSKNNLMSVPEPSNINLMILDEPAKQTVNLAKMPELPKPASKRGKLDLRFRNIPAQISTQIVRGQVREWGRKKLQSQRS